MAIRNMNKQRIEAIAEDAIKRILDSGLVDSTFVDEHFRAFVDLKNYRRDMEQDVQQAICDALDIA